MKLFTKDIDQKLFSQFKFGNQLEKQVVVAKIFNPYASNQRWYLVNSDPDDPNYIWAIVQMGDIVEVGSVHRQDLEKARVKPFNLPLERDLGYVQENADIVLEGLLAKTYYKEGGETKSQIKKFEKEEFLAYAYETTKELLKEHGLKLNEKFEISDGGKFIEPQIMYEHEGEKVTDLILSYIDEEQNLIGDIKFNLVSDEVDVEFVEWNIKDSTQYKKGGKTSAFERGVKAIEKNLEGKKVPSKYQSKYGKKYSAKEAHEAATRIKGKIASREKN